MDKEQNNNSNLPPDQKLPPAPTGNASNPSPEAEASSTNQLLDERAEKYLRESASIEDVPDAQDQEEMDKELG